MKNLFSQDTLHTVTEANINFYATPFVHPKRKMSEHDFIYMLQGEWKFGQNKRVYNLKKDHILILAANQKHYGISPCQAGTKTMYFHVSYENGDIIADSPENNTEYIDTLIDVSQNKNIKKLFSQTVNAKLSGSMRKANLYFELLLLELKQLNNATSDTTIAEKIKNIIHQNPEYFFTNKELSDKVNVSLKTAENKFKAEFGVTIHKYILNIRINEAKKMLLTTEHSLATIAENVGFNSNTHFSSYFKQVIGISPLEFRKQFKNKL